MIDERQCRNENNSHSLPVVSTSQAAGTLALDPDEYREDLAEFGLTEAQENEFLEALWSIMQTFVEIGFGVDSVHHIIPELALKPPASKANMLRMEHRENDEFFKNAARDSAAKEE